jgi:hypothetical protein
MTFRRTSVAVVIIAAIAAAGAGGCKAKSVIESVWPSASAERTVPKPPTPPRWPLTGLDAPDQQATLLRPLSVKIENSAPSRPQSGLDMADVVYETVTEGGITRFNAVFQSKQPKVAGPVRSVRYSDLYVVPQYQAIFAHCGGESNLQKALRDPRYADMDQFFNPSPYYRSAEKAAPHNLFVDLAKLRAAAVEKRKIKPTVELRPFAFERSSKEMTPVVTVITVPFATDNKAMWTYAAGTKTYLRDINGKAHKDKVSGKQYSARNVVVMWAKVSTRSHTDSAGTAALEIVLEGTGRASVFRDGQRFDGNWSADQNNPPVFKAANGATIKFSPGNTWFQVIANEQNIVIK